jgi:ribosomal protein L16 Arg81 hydroxylase
VTRDQALALLEERPLRAGDLVYLPRGVAHRGLGAALVQVITVPGFRPGAEIGLDHYLRAIAERLGLDGAESLPFHAAASDAPVVR